MGAPKKWSNEQIAAALKEARGMPSVAARRIGCSYSTVQRAIEDVDYVRAARDEAVAAMADTVEQTLYRMAVGIPAENKIIIVNGKEYEVPAYAVDPNITALIFLTKTHPAMRARGYTERHEVTGADGGALLQGLIINIGKDDSDG